MKIKQYIHAVSLALACVMSGGSLANAAETDGQKEDLKKMAEAFVKAFHKGDARALAAFWTPDGDYVDESGQAVKGRNAIEKSFADFFAENKGAKLRIDVTSLKFPTPDLAIEDGTSVVIPPDGSSPSRTRYTDVLIKKDGQWLLSSVREAAYVPPSNYESLRPLEWVIGDWVDEGADGVINHIDFTWGPGQNFIVGTRAGEDKEGAIQGGVQWIGWDPSAKQIRSWNFEPDGGFGESVWTKEGNKWLVKTKSTLSDGSKVTATDVVTPIDEKTVSWKMKDQTVNGKPLPDFKETKMKRAE